MTDKGKPFYEVPPEAVEQTRFENWNYNVSHHGDYVGIASEPTCLVGLDIMNAREKPRSRGTPDEFLRVFERQLSATEWGSIYDAPDEDTRLERFYKQWALKEAYIKAIGSGLALSPRRIEITGLDHSRRPNSEAPYDPALLRIDGSQRPHWRFKFYRWVRPARFFES
jgi:4'-phosphopantetheinyl transferase